MKEGNWRLRLLLETGMKKMPLLPADAVADKFPSTARGKSRDRCEVARLLHVADALVQIVVWLWCQFRLL